MTVNSFYILLNKYIATETISITSTYESTYDKSLSIVGIVLFQLLLKYIRDKRKSKFPRKYEHLGFLVFKNKFLSDDSKDSIITTFGTIQKMYMALCRLSYRWKFRRAETSVSTDLFLNPINITKPNSIIIYQNNKKYFFIVSDLLHITENALCRYQYNFEIESQMPKNPYTNQPFSIHNLYNLYFHLKHNTSIVIPSFFYLFFMEGFDLTLYVRKYEPVLRKLAIQNFVWSSDENDSILMADIDTMLGMYCYKKLTIHKNFPKQILFRVMQPYLYIYYLITYGEFEYEPLWFYEDLLETKMDKFMKKNPCFGKQKISLDFPRTPSFQWREEKEEIIKKKTVSFFTDTNNVVFHSKHL